MDRFDDHLSLLHLFRFGHRTRLKSILLLDTTYKRRFVPRYGSTRDEMKSSHDGLKFFAKEMRLLIYF